MNLTERRAQLVQQLQQAQAEATSWAQRAQQLQGALLLLDELLREQQNSVNKKPNGAGDDASEPRA